MKSEVGRDICGERRITFRTVVALTVDKVRVERGNVQCSSSVVVAHTWVSQANAKYSEWCYTGASRYTGYQIYRPVIVLRFA
jgi:hypothetical protein